MKDYELYGGETRLKVKFGIVNRIETTPEDYSVYQGDYTVTPKATAVQVLATKNCIMTSDVTVESVPHYEVSNDAGGTTVYIAKEM